MMLLVTAACVTNIMQCGVICTAVGLIIATTTGWPELLAQATITTTTTQFYAYDQLIQTNNNSNGRNYNTVQ